MTIQTETSVPAPDLTYSKTRGLVANLSGRLCFFRWMESLEPTL